MSERYPTNAVAFNTMEPKVTSAQSNASQKGAIYSNPSEQFPATEETSIPGSSEAEAPMVPSTTVTAVEATLAEVTQSPSYATTTQVSTANIDAATTGDTQIHAATTHAPKIDHQQMAPSCQPTAGIQSIVSNPMPITTETSITPATFLINNPVSTPLCISNSFAATTSSNACLSTSEEAAAAKVAVGQMAAIVVALLGVFGIFVACILVKKRKRTKKKKKKEQYHPFFYMNEPTDQQETSLSSETFVHRSNEALCQFYENERPAPNQTSDLSENVCDGNVFYNNSTSYHRSNSVVSHHEIHKALTVITSPAESHQRHTTSLLGKANMDPIMTVELYSVSNATISLLCQQKHGHGSTIYVSCESFRKQQREAAVLAVVA
ncbi:hypothetical protein BD408DRAFT_466726 [Parasitella parasitica]|nr:hypothetical protein BD408DRAFT_466726 [Parasitella parasitica]